MADIINPNPPILAAFDKLWLTNLIINFREPKLIAALAPYNGTFTLPSTVKLSFDLRVKRSEDAALDAVMTALVAEIDRQAGREGARILSVSAANPTGRVRATIIFDDGVTHVIPDCFALAATDTAFAGVLQGTLAEVARQADLAVV
jgi:hypothetical protein